MSLYAEPDALISAASRVNREWGSYGYTITDARSDTWGGVTLTVRHFDGSEFEVAVDRYGNAVQEVGRVVA